MDCFTKQDVETINNHIKRCLNISLIGNCKLEQQRDIIILLREWLKMRKKKKKPDKAISGEDTEETGQNNKGIL